MIDFIIVGAQKGGTTAAAFNLNKHPDISIFSGKTEYGRQAEIEFYNQHWDRGIAWYFEQLPKSKGLRGEKTAELLHRKICHKRIYSVKPDIKLIVLLRCPIERAFSQWRMAALNKGDETESFDDVVRNEFKKLKENKYLEDFYSCRETDISCWREGYILKGFYFEQLISLLEYFPKENIHIGIAERIMKNKEAEYSKIFSFLNVKPFKSNFENKFVGKTSQPIKNETFDLLKQVYSTPNEALFNLLGYEIEEWRK
jgi:hypothetical protein